MADGAFDSFARAAIYEAGAGRCIGCGSSQITAQHRRARGMGGTRLVGIGMAANGVPLCGSGVAGCHGWAEHNPTEAELLGWRLDRSGDAADPFWTMFGWRRWHVDDDGFPSVQYVDTDDLDRHPERVAAIEAYLSECA